MYLLSDWGVLGKEVVGCGEAALDFCAIVLQCSHLAQVLLIVLVLGDVNVPDSARQSKGQKELLCLMKDN